MSKKLNFAFAPLPIEAIKDLGLTSCCVLSSIIKHTGNNEFCFPSNRRIAQQLCISLPTVERALSKLDTKRYINRITKREENGKYNRKIYLTGKHESGIQHKVPPKGEEDINNKKPDFDSEEYRNMQSTHYWKNGKWNKRRENKMIV